MVPAHDDDTIEESTLQTFNELYHLDARQEAVEVPRHIFKAVQAGYKRVWTAISGVWGALEKTHRDLIIFCNETSAKLNTISENVEKNSKCLNQLLQQARGRQSNTRILASSSQRNDIDGPAIAQTEKELLDKGPPKYPVHKLWQLAGERLRRH